MHNARARSRPNTGTPPVGFGHISPRQRPSMSPREYQARLDLLHVQDCIWARMKPAEIARKLGKDKAWVSRAIQRLETERATEYRSPRESELIGDNVRQLESLLSSALAVAQREKEAKTQLSAIRTAADLLRQKADYEISVGFVQKHDARENAESRKASVELLHYVKEELPEDAVMKILEIRLRKRAEEKQAGIARGMTPATN